MTSVDLSERNEKWTARGSPISGRRVGHRLFPSVPLSRRQVVSDGRFNFMAVAREGRHADFPESGVIAVTQPGPNLEASHDISLIYHLASTVTVTIFQITYSGISLDCFDHMKDVNISGMSLIRISE